MRKKKKNIRRVLPIASKRGHNAENILSTPLEGGTVFETIELNVFVLLLLLAYYIDALLLVGVYMYVCMYRRSERKRERCTENALHQRLRIKQYILV